MDSSKDVCMHVVTEWQSFWMNQKENSEADYQNYFHRALGVDANMRHHLADKINEQLVSKLINQRNDLVAQLHTEEAHKIAIIKRMDEELG